VTQGRRVTWSLKTRPNLDDSLRASPSAMKRGAVDTEIVPRAIPTWPFDGHSREFTLLRKTKPSSAATLTNR
jgi:hypothetical protein